MLLLLPSLPSSASSGNIACFSSAVPDLVLNLVVERALLPQETVVYVPALKQGPVTVGSEVLVQCGLAAALVSGSLLLLGREEPFSSLRSKC